VLSRGARSIARRRSWRSCDLTTPQKGSPEGRVFGRPGTGRRRAYQYLDLVPKGRDEEGCKFPMESVRRHDQYLKHLEDARVAGNGG
jgi:hypothetical protein